jgi:hypothetical protein
LFRLILAGLILSEAKVLQSSLVAGKEANRLFPFPETSLVKVWGKCLGVALAILLLVLESVATQVVSAHRSRAVA